MNSTKIFKNTVKAIALITCLGGVVQADIPAYIQAPDIQAVYDQYPLVQLNMSQNNMKDLSDKINDYLEYNDKIGFDTRLHNVVQVTANHIEGIQNILNALTKAVTIMATNDTTELDNLRNSDDPNDRDIAKLVDVLSTDQPPKGYEKYFRGGDTFKTLIELLSIVQDYWNNYGSGTQIDNEGWRVRQAEHFLQYLYAMGWITYMAQNARAPMQDQVDFLNLLSRLSGGLLSTDLIKANKARSRTNFEDVFIAATTVVTGQ